MECYNWIYVLVREITNKISIQKEKEIKACQKSNGKQYKERKEKEKENSYKTYRNN
jgi:hypothetical protein